MTTTLEPVRRAIADGPVADVPARSRPPLAAILAVVGIPTFMVTLDNLVVTNALPVIRAELNASLTDLQ
ncbi:MAG TPA: MFS transporter, partial [Kribbellaceae bacterium]|nr:MFS transporter [Kribbellaceae bacterium]